MRYITLIILLLIINLGIAATYTMGTSGSQSTTISATSGAPDNFYDNGGSGANYSNNISGATYTFNCAGGNYVRAVISSLSFAGTGDILTIYNGNSTSARQIGSVSSGNNGNTFMWCSTSSDGSLTFKFDTDGAGVSGGWSISIYIDTYQGQLWNTGGTSSTNTASNWEGGVLPTAQSSIYIPSGGTQPTLDASLTVFDFRLASGATFTTTSTFALVLYGDIVIDGTYTNSNNYYTYLSGGSSGNYANISGSGSYSGINLLIGYHQNAFYKLNASITSKLLELYSSNSSGFDLNGYNITVSNTASNSVNIPASQSFYLRTGTLTTNSSSPTIVSASFNCNTGTVNFSRTGGNQLIPGVTYYNLLISGGNNRVKTLGGSTIVGNSITVNASTEFASGGYVLDQTGSLTNSGTCSVGSGTFNIGGSYSGSGVITISSGTLNVDGTFDATGGTVTFSGAGNLNLGGATITSLGTFTPSSSNTYYDRGGAQTVLAATYNNLYIATSGTKTLGGAIVTNGNLQISAGTFDVSGSNYAITCGGNWTNNGTFTQGSGTVTFNGASAQSLTGSSSTTFYNFVLNNTSATGVTLGVNTTISNLLTLTDGLLYTATYTLTLGTSSTDATIPAGSSTSYIVAYDNAGSIGYVKQFINNNATYNYPVGDATYFTPLTFQLTANSGLSSAYFTVYTKDAIIPAMKTGTLTTYLTRYWDGTSSGMTSPTYTITLTYDNTDIIGTEANLLPVKKTGTTWSAPTGSSFLTNTPVTTNLEGTGSVNTGSNTLTWSGLTTFSLYGGAGNQASALPVNLYLFSAITVENKVELNWSTASENNSAYFNVERSEDGNNFYTIGTLQAMGNSTQNVDYNFMDNNPFRGVSYYRLEQVDFDGTSTYSKVCSVIIKDNSFNIYPNPIENRVVSIYLDDNSYQKIHINLYDYSGRLILYRLVEKSYALNNFSIDVSTVQSGNYILQLVSENQVLDNIKIQIK